MVIIYVVFGICLLTGLWALTALISAMIKSGGPGNLIKAWLQALRGD